MKNIVDRQTFVFSFNFFTFTKPSQISTNMPLRFAADELVVKSISYAPFSIDPVSADIDTPNIVQIWCNVTTDPIIGAFPNAAITSSDHNDHFLLQSPFQSQQFILQFQTTETPIPALYYNPQILTSAQTVQKTKGYVSITIEFIKYEK